MPRGLVALFVCVVLKCSSSVSECSSSVSQCNRPEMSQSERTYIMVKPDGVQRGLVGEIVKRFEQKGFKLVAMKFMQVGQTGYCILISQGGVPRGYEGSS